MAILNGYCTLAEAKAAVNIPASDTSSDSSLELFVEGVSRWIDGPEACGRRFYAPSESRAYTPSRGDRVLIDDFASVSAVATDENGDGVYEIEWATTDYRLKPSNAALDGKPYTEIAISPNGTQSFPCLDEGLQITGECGYSATVPAKVKMACLLRVAQLWMFRQGPMGQMAGGEFGAISTAATPYAVIMDLLSEFRKIEVC